jgi:hypothetical protein
MDDIWNERNELSRELRKLHYYMLHDLYSTLLILVLILVFLMTGGETVRICVHTGTNTHFSSHSASVFKPESILSFPSKWTFI